MSGFEYWDAAFLIEGKDMKEICGNCKWSKQEVPFGDYFCMNEKSDAYGCENMYDDSCDEWEMNQNE